MAEGDYKLDLSDPRPPGEPSEASYAGGYEGDVDQIIDLRETTAADAADAAFSDTPAVKALVVLEAGGGETIEVLRALADQTYDNLSVTVLNASGAEPEAETAAACRNASWVAMPERTGFAEVANWALDHVDPVEFPFLLIQDQSTALAPAGLGYLLEEMYRSNAGVVGPKIVGWDDPSKLLSVGYGADRRGRRIELIESDEFDQDQYAGVSDVFVIPTGCQLIRTDLFVALGGFDPLMGDECQDLDLCWRAHTVAARVIVVPQAAARQVRSAPSRAQALSAYRERSRHRLRTLTVTSSRWSFFSTTIAGVVGLLLAAIGNLLRARPSYARASLGAISWNVRNARSARRRRRHLRGIRLVGDSEIHALQSRIGPSVGSIVEQSLRPTARIAQGFRSLQQSLVDERQRIASPVVVFLGIAVVLLGLGTYRLWGDPLVGAGQNPVVGDGRALISQWWFGYRSSGVGGVGAAPISFPILGALELAFSWAGNLLSTTLLLAPLVIAAVGSFRLVRPLGGARAAAAATALTVANPLTADALAAARWETLVLWAAAPFVIHSTARLADLSPWVGSSASQEKQSPNDHKRTFPVRLLRFGILIAVVATFAPAAVFLGMIAALSVTLFGLLTGRVYRIGYGAAGVLAAVVVPAVLHLPFSLQVLRGEGWSWMVGQRSPEQSVTGLADVVLFAVGGKNGSVLMWGLPLAAGLGLLFGRGRRFDAAVLAWTMAIVGFGFSGLASTADTPVPLPGADVPLVLAGAALSLGVGLSIRAVQIDLKRYGYGWRQFATVASALGGIAVLMLGFGQSLNGRHNHPEVGYSEITSLLPARSAESRILWLGDPSIVPAAMVASPSGVQFAITNGGGVTWEDRFLPTMSPTTSEVGVLLDVAYRGDSVRLGRLLAPFGIDYIVHQPQLAPAPYEGPDYPIPADLGAALGNQLDLRRQQATLNLIVFNNEASRGSALRVDDSFDESTTTVIDLLNTDLTTGAGVIPVQVTPTQIRFAPEPSLSAGDRVLVALPAEGWSPTGGTGSITETIGGTSLLKIENPGESFGMRFRPQSSWWLLQASQLALGLLAVVVAIRPSQRSPGDNGDRSMQNRARSVSANSEAELDLTDAPIDLDRTDQDPDRHGLTFAEELDALGSRSETVRAADRDQP